MCLLNHKFHGVVERVGGQSLLPGKPLRPGFGTFSVKRIGSGTYLHHHSVKACLLAHVEQFCKFALLVGHRQGFFAWPVNVIDRSDPDRAELTFGRCEQAGIKRRFEQ